MSPLATKDACKACRAPISFGITQKGKRMPLDVLEIPQVELDVAVSARRMIGAKPESALTGLQVFEDKTRIRQATLGDLGNRLPIFRSHFATCPEADRFRR